MKVKVYALKDFGVSRWCYVAWCPKCKVNLRVGWDRDDSHEGAFRLAEAHARSYSHNVRR
jgi:hypothetical protein